MKSRRTTVLISFIIIVAAIYGRILLLPGVDKSAQQSHITNEQSVK